MTGTPGDPLDAVPIGVMKVDAGWQVTYLNPAGAALVGYTADELVGVDYWSAFPANVDGAFGPRFREIARTRVPGTLVAFYPAPLDAWFEVQVVPTDDGGLDFYFTDVTARHETEERLALLARIGAELAGTLDVEAAARRVPELIVPALADWALLAVIDDDGRPRDMGWWHPDPARRPLVERYAAVRMTALPAHAPASRALSGETVAATGAEICALLPPGEARNLLAELAPRWGIALPLQARGRSLGSMTLWFEGQREATPELLATAREVADRSALALDNARLFDQQRQVAEELQRNLLTPPPRCEPVEIAVRYLPASTAARVGGDWYDAFVQPSGDLVLVIGDVVGHDVAAAAAMGQLRAMLRGIASYSDAGPSEVLRGVDAAMAVLQVSTYATAAVARIQQTPSERARGLARMQWGNAGHLPPLVVHPDGTLAAVADWKGELLLGVDATAPRAEQGTVLTAGTTVLLYTDGLVERRSTDLDEGMRRLRAAAAEFAGLPPERLCDALLERMVDRRPDDDVALVAVRLREPAGS